MRAHCARTCAQYATLRATLHAPRALTGALHSDSFNMILANFRLDPREGRAALAAGDPVEAFLHAVQAAVDSAPTPEDGEGPGWPNRGGGGRALPQPWP